MYIWGECKWPVKAWRGAAGVGVQRAVGGAAARALVRVALGARVGGRRAARRAGAAGVAARRAARGPQPRQARLRRARAPRQRRSPRPGPHSSFPSLLVLCLSIFQILGLEDV
jgi:hypothetical protein